MGLALTPDYVDRSPRTLQELRRTMDDTGPGATELCYSIQTYTREQLELARCACTQAAKGNGATERDRGHRGIPVWIPGLRELGQDGAGANRLEGRRGR